MPQRESAVVSLVLFVFLGMMAISCNWVLPSWNARPEGWGPEEKEAPKQPYSYGCDDSEYSQLHEVFEAAEPGATITVCDGEFDTNAYIDKSITLKANEGASPKFAGDVDVEITEEVDWLVEIEGIDLERLEVTYEESGQFRLHDSELHGNTNRSPIEIWFREAGGTAVLEDVYAHDTGQPTDILDAALDIKFEHPGASVTVRDSEFSDTVTGIQVQASASGGHVEVVSSRIRKMSSHAFKLYATASCDVSFHEVEVSGCSDGIDLYSGGDAQGEVKASFSYLEISDTSRPAVFLWPSAEGILFDVQMDNSQIHSNQESAIYIYLASALTRLHIETSSLRSNGGGAEHEAGALTLSNAEVTIEETEIVNNAGQEGGAILLRDDVQLSLDSCIVQSNATVFSDDCSGDECLGGAIQFGDSWSDDSVVMITDTDFGTSSTTENTPYDVATHQYIDSPLYPDPVDFVGVVTATCVHEGECI